MRVVEETIYRFDELKPEIQEKVIEEIRNENDFPFLEEYIKEQAKELLEEYDIEIINKFDINYSLSYSQGDGCMFEGKFKWDKYYVTVEHSGNYCHHNSKIISLDFVDDDFESASEEAEAFDQKNKDEKVFNADIYIPICKKLMRIGYDEIIHQNSGETIKEMILDSDWEFYSDGQVYKGAKYGKI